MRINRNMYIPQKGDPMHPLKDVTICLLSLSLLAEATLSQERYRSKIPDKYKWNLADLYPSDEAWKAAKEKLQAALPKVDQFRGKLAQSPATLASFMEAFSNLYKELSRLDVYASMSSDLDLNNSEHLKMVQDISKIGTDFDSQTAWLRPEILKMDSPTVDKFIQQEPRLKVFAHYLDDVLRRKAHTGTEGEQKIIADAGIMSDSPENIYSVFSNAEFPFPDVTLAGGKTVKLDKAAFALYRTVPNRADREKVFAAFFGKLNQFHQTFATDLYAEVKRDIFYKNSRNYGSCLQSALDRNNIPVQVYHSLVDGVNANLATFHRYLNLRKRMLGVDTLHYYDLYAPVVKNVDLAYSYDDAEKNIIASLAPLGQEYVATAEKGLDSRWVDVYPNAGKKSGAYSQGAAYDVHPYMLLNYNGKYDDMSTLAHELGHTMHSYLANKSQTFLNAQYSIFVAEVASTFNEALLIDHMLKSVKDDGTRLSMLGSYLDNMKATVFRQTQFAEFELRIHDMAEKGQSLTGDDLDKLYLEITRKYYGHDKGVCFVDDNIKAEWSYIPHFYLNFYVFQYATSFTASGALSEKVLAGEKGETDRYLTLLKSGGSDYPINLLKKAGVD